MKVANFALGMHMGESIVIGAAGDYYLGHKIEIYSPGTHQIDRIDVMLVKLDDLINYAHFTVLGTKISDPESKRRFLFKMNARKNKWAFKFDKFFKKFRLLDSKEAKKLLKMGWE